MGQVEQSRSSWGSQGSTRCTPASRQENCRPQAAGLCRRAEGGRRHRGFQRLADELWPLSAIVISVLLRRLPCGLMQPTKAAARGHGRPTNKLQAASWASRASISPPTARCSDSMNHSV